MVPFSVLSILPETLDFVFEPLSTRDILGRAQIISWLRKGHAHNIRRGTGEEADLRSTPPFAWRVPWSCWSSISM